MYHRGNIRVGAERGCCSWYWAELQELGLLQELFEDLLNLLKLIN